MPAEIIDDWEVSDHTFYCDCCGETFVKRGPEPPLFCPYCDEMHAVELDYSEIPGIEAHNDRVKAAIEAGITPLDHRIAELAEAFGKGGAIKVSTRAGSCRIEFPDAEGIRAGKLDGKAFRSKAAVRIGDTGELIIEIEDVEGSPATRTIKPEELTGYASLLPREPEAEA